MQAERNSLLNDAAGFWDGSTLYVDRTDYAYAWSHGQENVHRCNEVLLTLFEAQQIMDPTGCYRISSVAVYITCDTPDASKDVVMIQTEDNCSWTMYFEGRETSRLDKSGDKPVLCTIRHCGDTPALLGLQAAILKRKDVSRLSVVQLFKFLYLSYIPEIQLERRPGDNSFFAKEVFNKLSKSDTWTMFGNLPLSQSSGDQGSAKSNDIRWEGVIKYVDTIGYTDFDENDMNKLIFNTDPARNKQIERISVYKTPLNELQLTNLHFFHAFIVFSSIRGKLREWWSLEKNGNFLVLQRANDESEVRDKLLGDIRCKSSFYWKPQKIIEDTSELNVAQLIRFLYDNEELNMKYNGATENCQTFSKVLFDEVASSQTWDYGWVLTMLTKLNRKVLGLRDLRPMTKQS